ncbi:MAG: hypothetical protein JKY14_12285, partial [Paraglaciecola sp.]|nr:hypothetical protein [Paraglaciecola sp.]
MLSDFNIRTFTLLFICSISVMLFHAFGGMQISLPLLSASENAGFSEISSDNVTYNLALEDNIPTANCHLTDTSGYNICGISVSLGDDETRGKDLSLYNSIKLNVSILSPIEDARVRFSFRNFTHNYSNANDPISLKFNTIKYRPESANSQIIVQLSAFQ